MKFHEIQSARRKLKLRLEVINEVLDDMPETLDDYNDMDSDEREELELAIDDAMEGDD